MTETEATGTPSKFLSVPLPTKTIQPMTNYEGFKLQAQSEDGLTILVAGSWNKPERPTEIKKNAHPTKQFSSLGDWYFVEYNMPTPPAAPQPAAAARTSRCPFRVSEVHQDVQSHPDLRQIRLHVVLPVFCDAPASQQFRLTAWIGAQEELMQTREELRHMVTKLQEEFSEEKGACSKKTLNMALHAGVGQNGSLRVSYGAGHYIPVFSLVPSPLLQRETLNQFSKALATEVRMLLVRLANFRKIDLHCNSDQPPHLLKFQSREKSSTTHCRSRSLLSSLLMGYLASQVNLCVCVLVRCIVVELSAKESDEIRPVMSVGKQPGFRFLMTTADRSALQPPMLHPTSNWWGVSFTQTNRSTIIQWVPDLALVEPI
ncbi:hypothetical protein FA15DRAFT_654746 [Coprinopsis marcescibilis]|uniref:Uncharacterized protein n=1 Tax=Coprinopsis marcescibilis TaxID=230819 RepID=A0A5C3L0B3_COPMA|nr:hypothetical protein FA15DRAFT_654746 [Coprinopsis marcescibilis]